MRKNVASPFTWALWVLTGLGIVAVAFLVGLEVPMAPGVVALGVALTVVIVAAVWAIMARTSLWPQTGAGARPLWALLWGGCATLLLVFPSGTAWQAMVEHWNLTPLAYSFSGAWPEETGKALGVVLVLMAYPRIWDKPWHGLLLGTLVGLGFEMTENILYAVTGGYMHATSDLAGGLQMWGLRLGLGPGMHAMWTGISGFFISTALREVSKPAGGEMRPADARRAPSETFGLILLGWLIAFALHFAWNIQWPGAQETYVQLGWPIVVYIPTLVIYVLLWRRSLRAAKQERQAAAEHQQQLNEWAVPNVWTPPETAR